MSLFQDFFGLESTFFLCRAFRDLLVGGPLSFFFFSVALLSSVTEPIILKETGL